MLLSSCDVCKRASKRCPSQIITKDSTIYKEIVKYKDTTVFVYLPKDTVTINDTVYIVNGVCYMARKHTKNGIVSAWAEVINNRMNMQAFVNDSGVFYQLNNAIRESIYWSEKYKEKQQTIVVKENYLTWFQWVQVWLGRLFVLIALIYVSYIYVMHKLKL